MYAPKVEFDSGWYINVITNQYMWERTVNFSKTPSQYELESFKDHIKEWDCPGCNVCVKQQLGSIAVFTSK